MSTNLPLFDPLFAGKPEPQGPPLTGEDLKLSGMESVLSHTPEDYIDRFMKAIESLPRGYSFTMEEIRDRVGEPPIELHHNCFGALTRAAAKRELMRETGTHVRAKKPSLRSRKLVVWIRL